MKEYNKTNIPLAKTLRKNMTPWERKLWYEFLRLTCYNKVVTICPKVIK